MDFFSGSKISTIKIETKIAIIDLVVILTPRISGKRSAKPTTAAEINKTTRE
ncbi:MAG: hypothetical protein WC808_03640 [Patescibacteria group bacterium]